MRDERVHREMGRFTGGVIGLATTFLGANYVALSTGEYDAIRTHTDANGDEIREVIPASGEFSLEQFATGASFLVAAALIFWLLYTTRENK